MLNDICNTWHEMGPCNAWQQHAHDTIANTKHSYCFITAPRKAGKTRALAVIVAMCQLHAPQLAVHVACANKRMAEAFRNVVRELLGGAEPTAVFHTYSTLARSLRQPEHARVDVLVMDDAMYCREDDWYETVLTLGYVGTKLIAVSAPASHLNPFTRIAKSLENKRSRL